MGRGKGLWSVRFMRREKRGRGRLGHAKRTVLRTNESASGCVGGKCGNGGETPAFTQIQGERRWPPRHCRASALTNECQFNAWKAVNFDMPWTGSADEIWPLFRVWKVLNAAGRDDRLASKWAEWRRGKGGEGEDEP